MPRRVPVVFHLLAPNGRPVQTTRDLRSFWTRTYPDVRKELRGRYPEASLARGPVDGDPDRAHHPAPVAPLSQPRNAVPSVPKAPERRAREPRAKGRVPSCYTAQTKLLR